MSRRSTMARKPNPKKIPRTQADVDRAEEAGRNLGLEFALNLVLFVLKDKHNSTDEDILQLRDEFMYEVDSVAAGYLTYSDIKRTLKGDYDLSVNLVDRR